MSTQCSGQLKDGTPCHKVIRKGKYCIMHDPKKAKFRSNLGRLRRQGVLARQKGGSKEVDTLDTVFIKVLREIIRQELRKMQINFG